MQKPHLNNQLLARARKQHEARQRSVKDNIDAAAKEGADYLVNRARGKKIFTFR